MLSRRAVLTALVTTVLLSLGCNEVRYTNENTPTIVITPEMLEQMKEKEAQRQEKYRNMSIPERSR